MKAFLTGSRVYGQTHDDSDVDLVVFMNREDVIELYALAEKVDGSGSQFQPDAKEQELSREEAMHIDWDGPIACSLRFGSLNVICVTNHVAYHVWLRGTNELYNMNKEVSRVEAIKHFQALQVKHGIQPTIGEKKDGTRTF